MAHNWKTASIGAVADYQTGFPFKSEFYTDARNGVRLLRGDNIVQGSLRWDDAKHWPSSDVANYDQYQLREGDVVLAMDRPWIAAGLKYARISKYDLPCVLVQRTARLRGTANLDEGFLRYVVGGREFSQHIQSVSTGSIVPHVSGSQIKEFVFPLPPLKEQKAISAVLSALDDKIALNHRINAELEAMAKLLYDYWFVQFDFPISAAQAAALGKPGLEGQPYRSSGGKMTHHPDLKREIPAGWKVGNLEELCSMVRGVTYSKDDVRTPSDPGTVPILRATNVNNGIVDLSDLVYVTQDMPSEDQYLEKFDILVVMSSGSKAHVGKNALYCYDRKVAYGAFCSKVVPNSTSRFFVAVHMRSDPFKKYISNVCRGTSINNLTNAHIAKHKLPIPPREQLEHFEETVSSFFETIACHHQQNQELAALRDWLLPMLMNGQVTVAEP